MKRSSAAAAHADVIVAPQSPPCSPHAGCDGLAGLHRAPNHRYPPPRCPGATAVVQRASFRIAHPRQPARRAPAPHQRAPAGCDEWMMLKLDEDLSDHDAAYASDGFDSDEELGASRLRPGADTRATVRAAAAAVLPKSAPLRIPERSKPDAPRMRRRRVLPYLPHSSAYRPNAPAAGAARRKRRPSYSSSDSEPDDL